MSFIFLLGVSTDNIFKSNKIHDVPINLINRKLQFGCENTPKYLFTAIFVLN